MESFIQAESAIPITNDQHHAELFERFRGWTFAERVREVTSWIWDFGFDIQRIVNRDTTERRWICKLCIIQRRPNIKPITDSGLQNAAGHLYTHHRILAPDGKTKSREEKLSSGTSNRARSIAYFMNLNPEKPSEQAAINKAIQSFDRKRFQRLLVEWIVKENLPFSIAEHEGLRALFEYLNPQIAIQQANLTRPMIKIKILNEFHRHQDTVIATLQSAPGLIHYAFDGWRSGNRRNVFGICCFFRDSTSNQPRKIVLGLPELPGSHTGIKIGQVVVDLIEEFGVGDKTGYFVMDNAANNDTAMDFIGHKYGFDGRGRRGRCFGHILNLSAKLLLFGNEQQSVNSFVETPDQLTEAEYDLWRKEGPVGKLRILVIAIDSSDRLTDLFARLQANDISTAQTVCDRSKKPLHVVKDNQTRWLGSLYMIRRALQLRPYFDLLKVSYQREWEAENRSRALGSNSLRRSAKLPAFLEERNWLTPNDWAVIEHLERILTDYEHTLLRLEGDGQIRRRTGGFEGSYGNVWDVLPAFEFLLGRLEYYKAVASDVPDPIQFKVGVNAAWDKLNYYYSKLDETPIYYAAFALHPAKRWQGLEKMWESQNISWITAAKKIVKDVWLEQYRGRAIRPDCHSPTPTPEPSSKRRKVNNFERFLNSNTSSPASPTDHFNGLDEYDIWMAAIDEDDQYVEDPIAYWHSQRRRYPRLSQMALDLVTIQAMSAECERLFSAAGNLLDHSRSSLDIKLVGMCMALRSWLRAGILKDAVDPMLLSMSEEVENNLVNGLTEEEQKERATRWLKCIASARPSTAGSAGNRSE